MDKKPKYPNNLALLIKDSGMNQVDFAAQIGWNPVDVNRRVHGKNSIMPPQLEELRQKMGWTASMIYGEYTTPIDAEPRKQINTAIKLSLQGEDEASIKAIVDDAYKKIKSSYPPDIDTKRILISLLIDLQQRGVLLNRLEKAFLMWVGLKNPSLFGEEFAEIFAQDISIDNIGKLRKGTRQEFVDLLNKIGVI